MSALRCVRHYFHIFQRAAGVAPDRTSFVALADAHSKSGNIHNALRITKLLQEAGFSLDTRMSSMVRYGVCNVRRRDHRVFLGRFFEYVSY